MKLIISIFTILFFSSQYLYAEKNDCNKYEKISKEYATCTSNLLKNKSIEIKDKTTNKFIESKKKFNKSNLKKKLLKFKNSKNLKEFIED